MYGMCYCVYCVVGVCTVCVIVYAVLSLTTLVKIVRLNVITPSQQDVVLARLFILMYNMHVRVLFVFFLIPISTFNRAQ